MTDLHERGWSLTPVPDLYSDKLPPSVVTVELVPGVVVPAKVVAAGPALDTEVSQSLRIELEARFDVWSGTYLLRRLSLIAQDGTEVNGVLLREIAPLRLMRWLLPRTFQVDRQQLSVYVVDYIAPEIREVRDAQGVARLKPTLQDAAMVYNIARAVRDAPAKAVAETLGLQTRTATNWLLRAREAGLLRMPLGES